EDIAAAILEAWEASEDALRALVGQPSLGGQALIRELRQRNALTLDQAHALVEFGAAAERVKVSDYPPTEADVRAARVGFQQLEAVAHGQAKYEVRGASGEVKPPTIDEQAPAAQAAPAPTLASRISHLAPYRRSTLGMVIALVLIVAVVGAGLYYAWRWWSGPRAIEQAKAAYAAGRRTEARDMFVAIARRSPDLAEPHIYLGRMAREDGDRATALRELDLAVKLDPNNATAHREMGSYLLSIGNPQLASRFYVRAIETNPRDRTAMGYLACALAQLGRFPEAQNFLNRAGQGPWSACAAPPPMQPGMQPPPPVR
ncbi:MAG TPA: tetratricopeptide repeat protein, partial [Gemmatimonadaceae bacterium]|nr:tetratricopeptide repeat protein [Gemmatimonadaceae bacterium]